MPAQVNTYNYNPTGRNNSGFSTESTSVRGSFAAPTPTATMPFSQAFSSAPSLAQSYTLPGTTTPGASMNFDASEFVTDPVDAGLGVNDLSLFGLDNMDRDLAGMNSFEEEFKLFEGVDFDGGEGEADAGN